MTCDTRSSDCVLESLASKDLTDVVLWFNLEALTDCGQPTLSLMDSNKMLTFHLGDITP